MFMLQQVLTIQVSKKGRAKKKKKKPAPKKRDRKPVRKGGAGPRNVPSAHRRGQKKKQKKLDPEDYEDAKLLDARARQAKRVDDGRKPEMRTYAVGSVQGVKPFCLFLTELVYYYYSQLHSLLIKATLATELLRRSFGVALAKTMC